jgi:hypothetical protein
VQKATEEELAEEQADNAETPEGSENIENTQTNE